MLKGSKTVPQLIEVLELSFHGGFKKLNDEVLISQMLDLLLQLRKIILMAYAEVYLSDSSKISNVFEAV
jgi:hypothetical protein